MALEIGHIEEYKGRDKYGRTHYQVYAMREKQGWGMVAIITVLPVAAAREGGARHMVTDRRIEKQAENNAKRHADLKAGINDGWPPIYKGLKAAREAAAALAAA